MAQRIVVGVVCLMAVVVAADPTGYVCADNKNYEGEKTCFSGSCPLENVSTEEKCASHCDKKTSCTVFVYNNKLECYLKSDHTKSVDDDPNLHTVSCEKSGTPAPGPPAPGGNSTTVEPDSSHISYIGRFDKKDSKNPQFSWSAAQIGLTFNGSTYLKAHFTAPAPGMRILGKWAPHPSWSAHSPFI